MIEVDNLLHAQAIAKAVGAIYDPKYDHCVSRRNEKGLLGGCIYQNYTGSSIQVHVAGFDTRWVSHDLLWAMSAYPFLQLNCRIAIAQVPETNTRSLAFNHKFGFKEVARIPDAFLDGAAVVLILRREECRWLNLTPRSRFWERKTNGEGQPRLSTA